MNNKDSLVSVIIAVRNGEKTIKNSVESVLQQSYSNLELIVIVNGSNDSTEDIVNSFNDKRLIVISSEPGVVAARNAGLRICKGDFIAIQDADDVWYPEKLKNQVDFLLKNPQIDILGCQMLIVESGIEKIKTSYPLEDLECKQWLLNANNPIGHPSVIYRSNVIDKVGGYWEFFPLAEDMDFFYRCMPHFNFGNLETVEMVYNHTPKSNYDPRIPKLMAALYGKIYEIIK